MAKNSEDARSDIDVMLVGDVSVDAIHEAIMKTEKRLCREINYSIFSPSDWKKQLRQKKAFVSSIARDQKIFLIGSADDLQKMS